jgi:hypothetical protein
MIPGVPIVQIIRGERGEVFKDVTEDWLPLGYETDVLGPG